MLALVPFASLPPSLPPGLPPVLCSPPVPCLLLPSSYNALQHEYHRYRETSRRDESRHKELHADLADMEVKLGEVREALRETLEEARRSKQAADAAEAARVKSREEAER